MRWERLFHDLEGQVEAAENAAFRADLQDRTRAERAAITLASRLHDATGVDLVLTLTDGAVVSGVVEDAASQWVLLGGRTQRLIPVHAICAISGLPSRSVEVGPVAQRLSLGYALRALARDRVRVVVETAGGQVQGLIAKVGADFFEVSQGSQGLVAIPTQSIVQVRAAAL